MKLRNRFKKVLPVFREDNIDNSLAHTGFMIAMLIKGIDGVLEIIGGILLMFVSPARLNRIITLLTQHELSEDPRDIISNYIIRISSHFSISAQHFGEFYLISHGLVKLILIILLWNKKIWAYPLSVAFLLLFILYQLHRYTYSHSIGLILLTIFDIIMIALTLREYKKIKLEQ